MKPESSSMPLEKRILVAGGIFLLIGTGSGIVWVLGMMMLMFAGDSASGSKIPTWLELMMLVGWPITLGIMSVGIPILIAIGPRLRWILLGSAVLLAIPVVVYLIGFVTMVRLSLD